MQRPPPERTRTAGTGVGVDDDALVLRNYDDSETYTLTVRMRDAADDVAFERTYELGPVEEVHTRARLERGVYAVTVRRADGAAATRECLIGSGPAETAVVETGNGVCSIAEGR